MWSCSDEFKTWSCLDEVDRYIKELGEFLREFRLSCIYHNIIQIHNNVLWDFVELNVGNVKEY